MSFILEIGLNTHQDYMPDYLRSFFEGEGLKVNLHRTPDAVAVEADENDAGLEPALHALNEQMTYSLFMSSVSHRFSGERFVYQEPEAKDVIPLNLGLCPTCVSEMFDPQSRRYYYPFTACRHCGPQYAFFEQFPYERANTAWRFVVPCSACEEEVQSNPFRRGFVQISCHECSVALEMTHGGKSRYANNAKSCKQLFELSAKALSEGKSVLMKTTFGWRRFYVPTAQNVSEASVLLHCNHKDLMDDLSLTKQEIEAFFSLEKPMLKVAVQAEGLKAIFGNVTRCKIPDEAFTLLLSRELNALHIDYVAFESCGEGSEADYRVGFDLPLAVQSEMECFIGGEARFVKAGERVSFPARVASAVDTLSVTENLVAVKQGETHTISRMEHFEGATASKMNLLEGCESVAEHSNTHAFSTAQGAMRGALASHGLTGRAVGVYFEGDRVDFLHFNGTHLTHVVPSIAFEPGRLIETLASLREGSDRLIANIDKNHPDFYAVLRWIETGELSLFDAAAAVIGLKGHGFDAIDNQALQFMGKGGTQIDTAMGDTRFNPYAMLASLISYKMADVEPIMLSYSLFESLGDYFVDILTQLQEKAKAEHIVLCGAQIGQTSLYSRIMQKMKGHPPLVNRSFPIGSEGAVVGGIYL